MDNRARPAYFFFLLLFLPVYALAIEGNIDWKKINDKEVRITGARRIMPVKYTVVSVNGATLRNMLASYPSSPSVIKTFVLPTPNGSTRTFRLWQTPIIDPLAAPYIQTLTGVAIDDSRATVKIDYTLWGFHAMVSDGANGYLIDPYTDEDNGYYQCYYRKDYERKGVLVTCDVEDGYEDGMQQAGKITATPTGLPPISMKVNGSQKSSYRLALACTKEYAVAVCGTSIPTKALTLSAMVTSMNRVNGVYEKEAGITMQLIPNDTDIIFLDGNLYANGSGPTMKTQNQRVVDSVVGNANYDIGHVFSTGGSGIAQLRSVCDTDTKAQGVTGQPNPVGDYFDIDFVAHEMGHQLGATHTFNSNSCGASNVASISAYEPGSGSTLMAYAGICASYDNIQPHSDDYFHVRSLDQISDFIKSPLEGGACVITSASGNTPSALPSFSRKEYTIPYLTPFELTAPAAADADHDSLNYCWEQLDLGDLGQPFASTSKYGPIFRSFRPSESPTRVFPRIEKIRNNENSYLGEKLPSEDRVLKFALTVRDIYNGWGCFNALDDTMRLNVINTGTPFTVASPNSAEAYWQAGSTAIVNWNVGNTDVAPINTPNVDIYLSLDDGTTFPIVLATGIANDGNETVNVPAGISTASARVKVKGSGNVFFDISNYGFIINEWSTGVTNMDNTQGLKIYPIPADNKLHVEYKGTDHKLSVYNAIGQQMVEIQLERSHEISTSNWPSGVYFVYVFDQSSGKKIVKTISVQH